MVWTCLRGLDRNDRVAVHWGMSLAAYPFWGSVAAHTGRLLRLQSSAAAPQVQRRIMERYGERATVGRATRRILRAFIDWGILSDTPSKGIYVQGKRHTVRDPKRIAWLAEAVLTARPTGSAAAQDLLESPSLFPFRLTQMPVRQVVALSPRLDLFRHGLNDDLVMLRKACHG